MINNQKVMKIKPYSCILTIRLRRLWKQFSHSNLRNKWKCQYNSVLCQLLKLIWIHNYPKCLKSHYHSIIKCSSIKPSYLKLSSLLPMRSFYLPKLMDRKLARLSVLWTMTKRLFQILRFSGYSTFIFQIYPSFNYS